MTRPSPCAACGKREVDPASFDWLCAPCDELQDLDILRVADDEHTTEELFA